MAREKTVEKKSCAIAKQNGWLAFKWVSPNNRGVPDRVFFRQGRTLIIEFKAPGKEPSKLQSHIIEKLKNEGMEVYVIDNIEAAAPLFA